MTLEELRESRSHRRLTQAERVAYCKHWASSGLTKRSFCQRELIAVGTFMSWFKGFESIESMDEGFIPVSVKRNNRVLESSHKELIVSLPNGLSVSGLFSCGELVHWIKELSDAVTPLHG